VLGPNARLLDEQALELLLAQRRSQQRIVEAREPVEAERGM